MPAKNPVRIPVLDGIRGYASLWVMLGHFSTRTGFFVPILGSPDIAVGIFMIVSGFLMTQHAFARQNIEPWESPRTWLIFYVRRLFRIAPLYYVLLIPSFLAFDFLNLAQQEQLRRLLNISFHPSTTADTTNVLMHVSFLFGLSPKYCDALLIPDWSLGLEMQFYALFPFLMLLARRTGALRFSLLMLAVWGVFRKLSGLAGTSRSFFSMPSWLGLNLGFFLIGIVLAWAWSTEKGKLTSRASILLLVIALIASLAKGQTASATGIIFLIVSIFLTLLLFRDQELESFDRGIDYWINRLRAILGNRVAHFLADVSYGVYLLHLLVMIPVLTVLCNIPQFLSQKSAVRFLILTAICGPLTYCFAWILFRTLEAPGIRLGKIVVAKLLVTGHPAAAAK
jgi:peptidoglycan/LPS O-acetylase OafA/YrhL